MCIIMAKPAGVPMPSEEIITRCFNSNPDGAGYMVADGSRVRIKKGYMTLSALLAALSEEQDLTENAVVLHCRITTHGKTDARLCHPFPITSDVEAMRRQKYMDVMGIAHNGIINGMTIDDDMTSDTMAYIRDVVAPLRRMCASFDDVNTLSILEATCNNSRLVVLDKSGHLSFINRETWICSDGIYYSNDSFERDRFAVWYTDDDNQKWPDDALPFDACEWCAYASMCAYDMPYCQTAFEAETEAADSWDYDEFTNDKTDKGE